MTSRRTVPVLVLLGLALAGLAACGERSSSGGGSDERAPDDARGSVQVVDGSVLVSCGGVPAFPASAMVDGADGSTPEDEVRAALDAVATDPKLSMETSRVLPQGGRTPYTLLVDDGATLVVGLGDWSADGPTRDAYQMTLERTGDSWVWRGHGNCTQLAPVLGEGEMWVEVSAGPVPSDATEIPVQVMERACTSSRDPAPHLHEPTVVSTDESMTVYWTSTPPEGGQNCPGNPSSPQTLTLPEPLGERQLLDGSRWPPVPLG
jgi:hypothetical protein